MQGDTEKVPFGRKTYAARSSVLGGSALRLAANAIIEKAKPMAAHLLEASADDIKFEGGDFRVRGTDRSIAMVDTAKAFYAPVLSPGVRSASKPAPASTAWSRAIRTAVMSARSSSIRIPAKSKSIATSWSMTAGDRSTR